MSQNLLDLVQNHFGGDTTRQASAALGENESSISTALRSIVPLVMGAVFARSQQPGGTTDLFGMARQAHSSGILDNLSSLLGGASPAGTTAPATDGGLLSRGTELLRSVLGLQFAPAVEQVSQSAGVRTSTTNSLINMAMPAVLGLMGRHAATNSLDERGFSNYLNEQRGSVLGAISSLPGNLGGLLSRVGLGAADAVGGATTAARNAADSLGGAAARTMSTAERPAAPARWPWLLLLLAGLAALWYFTRSCNREPGTATTPTTVADTAAVAAAPAPAPAAPTGRYDEASGNYIYDVGAPTTIKLPDGTSLTVGGNSVEIRLFNFLNDANQTVGNDKAQGWMSLDRVYFNTGKATLTDESRAQLKNVAVILKAFPNATIKLGGYTDNVGQAEKNLLLSADRANAARKAIMDNGLDPARVAAEGYGLEHPIASNDTPAGRAQNRRVDVRVTKK